jgi:hypothetical protein
MSNIATFARDKPKTKIGSLQNPATHVTPVTFSVVEKDWRRHISRSVKQDWLKLAKITLEGVP